MLEATTMSPDRTLDLLNSLRKATDRLVNLRGAAGPAFAIASTTSLGEMQKQIDAFKLETERVLAEAALSVARFRLGIPERTRRDALEFLVADKTPPGRLRYTLAASVSWSLVPERVHKALANANRTIETIHDLSVANNVPIFQLLGLRNLSSFVGEIFSRELCVLEEGSLLSNPNQDGYPDLLAMTPPGLAYVKEREKLGQMSAKGFWSPFPHGGVEVKATCGNTPPAKHIPKPLIGEPRLPILVSAEWKAHHRLTNNLLGLYWDFFEGLPTILAAFYRNDLTGDDWGEIIQPREGGGRTTSVSIMRRVGVLRMGQGWVVLPAHPELLAPMRQERAFGITDSLISSVCSSFRLEAATLDRSEQR